MAGNGGRRRGSQRVGSDLVEVVAMLPWWAGLCLAVLFYLWLHQLAAAPAPAASGAGQVGSAAVATMKQMAASIGQYLLPGLCLAGSALSAWRRRERRRLAEEAAAKSDLADALHGMSWQRFELLVGEAFRQRGYRVIENGGGGADGGVDLLLSKGADKYLVQCKQWRAQKVGVTVVRELFGLMAAHRAAGGFVVSAGRFTDEAKAFASGRNVELIDGVALHAMLKASADLAPSQAAPSRSAVAPEPAREASPPPCPRCGRPMVERTAKLGAGQGQAFWGCSTFPSCRGTRSMT